MIKIVPLVYGSVLEELRKTGNIISVEYFKFFVANYNIRAIIARAVYAGLFR